jgi:cyclomaltodextrinase
MDRWLLHDSHQAVFRQPFGSVPCKTEVTLRLLVKKTVQKVSLLLHPDGQSPCEIEMKPSTTVTSAIPDETYYEVTIPTPGSPGLLWYRFLVYDHDRIHHYGNQTGKGGIGGVSDMPAADYQITVYRPDAATPAWWKDAIVYHIFVDRFCNGNRDGSILHPKKNSLLHAHWEDDPLYIRDPETREVVRWDFFGGNLLGIEQKLEYLKELGISAIYLSPIFESPSNHKYDTGNYLKIDPMFGDREQFDKLCKQAQRMGMAIVLDGVFSHTGSDSMYFNKQGTYDSLGAYQSPDSPYYSWYRFRRYPDVYECWWGIKTLPNVDELNPHYLDFIIRCEDSVLKTWQRAGARGWRLDVADELPDAFIELFYRTLKQTDPESVLIGEVWEDASNKISYGKRRAYWNGGYLDSVTNYPFRNIAIDFITGKKNAQETHLALMNLYENYPSHYFYSTLNLLGSHDVPRILTILKVELAHLLEPERTDLAVRQLKLLSLWQISFPGVPCIYYGDEAGLEGGDDPDNRRTYPWGKEHKALLAWYRNITRLRCTYDVLRTGDWISIYQGEDVYGYVRRITGGRDRFGQEKADNVALVLFNRHLQQSCPCAIPMGDAITELTEICCDGETLQIAGVHAVTDGTMQVLMPPLTARVFLLHV